MDSSHASLSEVATTSKRIAQQLFTIGENRLELFTVELEEERERLFSAVWLTLGIAVFSLLTGMVFTALVIVLFWAQWPVGTLVVLTVVYGLIGVFLFRQLAHLRRDWLTFPATIEQLRKDRECLKKLT